MNMIPFLMVAIAFFIHRNNSTNLAAVSIYIFFYSITLIPHMLLEPTEWIFVWNVLNASALCMLMSVTCSKPTLLVLLIILTEFVLAILNSVCFIAYNHYQDGVYQAALVLIDVTIGLQWASLWVWTDGIITNAGSHDTIVRYLLDRTRSIFRHS